MIITCPACATQFRVPDGALGDNGRKLRCSSCRHVWFQTPPAAEAESGPAAQEAAAPASQAPAPPPPEPPLEETADPEVSIAATGESVPAETETPAEAIDTPPEATSVSREAPPPEGEAEAQTLSESEPTATVAPDLPAGDTAEPETPEASAPVDDAPPSATTGWEPGAILPRAGKREADAETPRPGLRLVARENRAGTEAQAGSAAAAAPAQAAPAYDVTRVLTPDSAPEEKPARAPRKRRSGLILVLLLLVAIGAVAYFERTQVMRYLPQTASLYGLVGLVGAPSSQGLQLHDVAFRFEEDGDTASLIISGKVMNVGRDYRLLPDLRVLLLDGDMEATESWALRTTAEGLAPGATTVFEAVYADPPRTGTDEAIFVTFADLM